MAINFFTETDQFDYDETDTTSFQGQLASSYTAALAATLQQEIVADWIGFLAHSVNGLSVADALLVKAAVTEGAFTLSGLFGAAQNKGPIALANPTDPVPMLTVTIGLITHSINLAPLLSDLDTESWTQTTGSGAKTTITTYIREFFTDADAPPLYGSGWAVPVVVSVTDDTGPSNTDGITSDKTLVIKGTAEANSSVEVFLDGNSIGATTADSSGDWSFDYTFATLMDGTYTFTAKATDADGNVSDESAALNVTVDTQAASDLQFAAVSVAADSTTAALIATLSAVGAPDTYIFSINNQSTAGKFVITEGNLLTLAVGQSLGSDQVYSVVIDVTDLAGNIYSETVRIASGGTVSQDNDTYSPATPDNFTDIVYGFSGIDNLSGAGGHDALFGGAGRDTLNGGPGRDTLNGGEGNDTLSGNLEDDTLNGDGGNDILNGGENDDTLNGGADDDTLNGNAGNDTLNGGENNDTLNGNNGIDILNGEAGSDILDGGSSFDSFVFSPGDSGQSDATEDTIFGFEKGAVGTGDEIDYQSALTVGGSDTPASATEASIDAITGVATFDAGSGTDLDDALRDIAMRFTAATDTSGEFALFQVNNTGNYHLFISDGVAGVTANDVVVELFGVTTIGSIDFGSGDLTILT